MKKTSITISFDEEKLSALKMYLTQRGVQVESELERSLETLYTKTVPAGVREFIEMKSGNTPKPAPTVITATWKSPMQHRRHIPRRRSKSETVKWLIVPTLSSAVLSVKKAVPGRQFSMPSGKKKQ